MKILYVSRSATGTPHPFIKEQADILNQRYHVAIQHFLIGSGGIKGYLKAIQQLKAVLQKENPVLIHAHYGLSALVVVIVNWLFKNKFKLVVTYHGSDINKSNERRFSLFAAQFAHHNILVSEKMATYFKKRYSVIPCGIDTDIVLGSKPEARRALGWNEKDFVVLFSSSFDRSEKDPAFAHQVIHSIQQTLSRPVRFLELKGYTRAQLTRIMQAADALLLCSIREGSPQVIKEAIINALPVVSNSIGDVPLICKGVDNCFIVPKTVEAFSKALQTIAQTGVRITNRAPVINTYDNKMIAAKLYAIYCKVLNLDIPDNNIKPTTETAPKKVVMTDHTYVTAKVG